MININSELYWDRRFSSGDWEKSKGRIQTKEFARSQVSLLEISNDFSGSILDFGCGLGDAFPIYKRAFPNAKLYGIDISEEAIKECKKVYGHLGTFFHGEYNKVPYVDIIIASNVFEHLSDDKLIARNLLKKCKTLYIAVPYKEKLVENSEHINSFDEFYFDGNFKYKYKIFTSKGWGYKGIRLIYYIYLKNILRVFLRKSPVNRSKQILFIIENKVNRDIYTL